MHPDLLTGCFTFCTMKSRSTRQSSGLWASHPPSASLRSLSHRARVPDFSHTLSSTPSPLRPSRNRKSLASAFSSNLRHFPSTLIPVSFINPSPWVESDPPSLRFQVILKVHYDIRELLDSVLFAPTLPPLQSTEKADFYASSYRRFVAFFLWQIASQWMYRQI